MHQVDRKGFGIIMSLPKDSIKRLSAIMTLLRSEQGCPWDKEQTPKSLKPYLLEEAYEVMAAIDSDNPDNIRDELGDLLLQITFLSELFEESGEFNFNDVAEAICEKLIRRHPHVFGESQEKNLEQLDRQWEQIKENENADYLHSRLGSAQRAFPALMSAQKITRKAARVGFDWNTHTEVIEQLQLELKELETAINEKDKKAIHEELGDVIFTAVNLGRHLEVDCETALIDTINRFRSRFEFMENSIKKDKLDIEQLDMDCLNRYWDEAKKFETG